MNCSSHSTDTNTTNTKKDNQNSYTSTTHKVYSDEDNYQSNDDGDIRTEDEIENDNGCKYADGTHSATVEYYNPETGTRSTYTLDVEVENCEVTVIYFPKGGWLDDSHITPDELDSYGSVTLYDDENREFEVQIDD